MPREVPLVPRNGHTLQVLVVARISGCGKQKEVSLDDQVEHARQDIAELYRGKVEFLVIATKAKGERLDRPELAEAEAFILQGEIDVVYMEDVGRLIRGAAAVELWGMAVDRKIRCIAPNDGCDTVNDTWEEDLMSACTNHVSHCAHTSRRIKHKSMTRFKRTGGPLPTLPYGYIKPEGAKTYGEIVKDDAATPFLKRGLEMLRSTLCWMSVVDLFNRLEVPTGPRCRHRHWNRNRVRILFTNPMLKGMPQRGAKHTIKHNETGRRVAVKNPAGPTYRDEPHLAHFEPEELDEVLALLAARHARPDRKRIQPVRGSGKRSRFPGRHAMCWYCGHQLTWGANGIAGNLSCQGARDYHCWNSIGVNGNLITSRIVDAISTMLQQLDHFDAELRTVVDIAMAAPCSAARELEAVKREQERLSREEQNLLNAIRQAGPKPMLEKAIGELEEQAQNLARQRSNLERRLRSKLSLPTSAAELRAEFEQAFHGLAKDSFEFGDLLRRIVPSIHVYLVRSCSGGHFLPRASVRLALGGLTRDMQSAPDLAIVLSRQLTVDLFKYPQHVRIREDAVRLSQEGMYQRDIAHSLGVCQRAVFNALELHKMMMKQGLESPYMLVTEPPQSDESYKKLRRHLRDRYRFEPVAGYVPPPL